MLFHPRSPTIPDDLLAKFGEPESAFGPNMRFRIVSVICGIMLIAMAVVYVLMSIGPNPLPLAGGVSHLLTFGLIVLGGFCIVAPRIVSANWVFVCPRGVVRTRGAIWEGLEWDRVARFEDATLKSGITTMRQCRLVLHDGSEWGFIADWIGDYRRLAEVMRQKVEEEKRVRRPDAAASD
jgi:hypothetical protein